MQQMIHGSHSPGQHFSLSLLEAVDGWSKFPLSKAVAATAADSFGGQEHSVQEKNFPFHILVRESKSNVLQGKALTSSQCSMQSSALLMNIENRKE